jgi:hypothetical protein
MYHPSQVAKWRQVLLHKPITLYSLIHPTSLIRWVWDSSLAHWAEVTKLGHFLDKLSLSPKPSLLPEIGIARLDSNIISFCVILIWILLAEKLSSSSNAFCSRTVGGLNRDPCFNGIWQEFCSTSPSAGQKWRECGDKHPTGGTVPLILP